MWIRRWWLRILEVLRDWLGIILLEANIWRGWRVRKDRLVKDWFFRIFGGWIASCWCIIIVFRKGLRSILKILRCLSGFWKGNIGNWKIIGLWKKLKLKMKSVKFSRPIPTFLNRFTMLDKTSSYSIFKRSPLMVFILTPQERFAVRLSFKPWFTLMQNLKKLQRLQPFSRWTQQVNFRFKLKTLI